MIPTLRSAAAVGKLSHRASSALSSTSSPSSVTCGFHHQPKSYHHPHFQDSRWTVFLLQARWQSSSTSSQALHAPFGPISRSSAASSVGSGVRKAEVSNQKEREKEYFFCVHLLAFAISAHILVMINQQQCVNVMTVTD